MKILVFTDLHANKRFIKLLKRRSKDVDIIINLGDYTVFERDNDKILSELDSLGKKVLMLHGNHENASSLKAVCKEYHNLEFVHKKVKKIKSFYFLCWGGGGFSRKDVDFENFVSKAKYDNPFILLTHAPPYKTALDMVCGHHVGNKSIRDFIIKNEPMIALSGHIHDTFGIKAKLGSTTIINPGPLGVILEL